MRIYYFLLTLLIITAPSSSYADRESDLEGLFPGAIIETFDNDENWRPTSTTDLPTKSDLSPTIWTSLTYETGGGPVSDWIGDQGPDYTWSGKTLCINYKNLGDNTGNIGYGPSRLRAYIGDGNAHHGYKKIHVFYMWKMHNDFCVRAEDDSRWANISGYLKLTEVLSGFRSDSVFGTEDEYAITCDNPQVRNEYGANFNVFQLTTPNELPNVMCFLNVPPTAYYSVSGDSIAQDDCWHYLVQAPYPTSKMVDTDFAELRALNEWIGVEIIMDIGTVDTADGSLTIKIYDSTGNLHTQQTSSNVVMKREFDHFYNKFTFGGNLIAAQPWGNNNMCYYDDLIITGVKHDNTGSDTDIAPIYFALLAGSTIYDQPTISIDDTNAGYSSSGVITGIATKDDALSFGLCTWSHSEGSFTGFATVLLGVVSGTVTGLPVGATTVSFSLFDSEDQEATDTAVFTRSPAATDVSKGITIQGVQWNQ